MVILKKFSAELIGTMILVLFGCGSAAIAGDSLGVLGIAASFGLSIIALVYVIGGISGCHINPAVSLAMWINRRMSTKELGIYIVAQIIGAIVGASLLAFIISSTGTMSIKGSGMGVNGFGKGYGVELNMVGAFIVEVILTFVFIFTILGATSYKKFESVSGIVIGFSLMFVHILGINLTGTSVNPARAIGPAIFIGGTSVSQLWVFILAPLVGSIIASLFWKFMISNK